AGTGFAEQEFNAVLHGMEIMDIFVAGFADGGSQGLAVYAGDGLLAGGINIGEDEDIGEIKRHSEFVPEMLGARVTVRLEEDQHAIEPAQLGGVDGCAAFER